MLSPVVQQATEALARAIRESGEYAAYHQRKEAVTQSDANRALLKEYQKAQTALQMAAMAGKEADEDAARRFSKLTSLLYEDDEVAGYLLAQIRMRQLAGEVFQRVAEAAELDMELPGL